MRVFELYGDGGRFAEGVVFSDGTCVVRRTVTPLSTASYESVGEASVAVDAAHVVYVGGSS